MNSDNLSIVLDTLIFKNQDIIQRYLSEISKSNRSYDYIDNKVYHCIYEIAEKEGRSDLAPKKDETLSEWRERAGIPQAYLELALYLNTLFSDTQKELVKHRKDYGEGQYNYTDQPIDDVHSEPLQPESNVSTEQSVSHPEKWKNIYLVVFYFFLLIICPTVFFYCMDHGMGGVGIFIFSIPVGILIWCYAKGIWKNPTKEEKEAMREESMRKWGTVKSAHIIRLERGLYTGLGNRRPYPHGRRTKKY